MSMRIVRSGGDFRIDLSSVMDGDRFVARAGLHGSNVVPELGEVVVAVDEDGNSYDAVVETVMPDSRVHLRVSWPSQRRTVLRDPGVSFATTWHTCRQ